MCLEMQSFPSLQDREYFHKAANLIKSLEIIDSINHELMIDSRVFGPVTIISAQEYNFKRGKNKLEKDKRKRTLNKS